MMHSSRGIHFQVDCYYYNPDGTATWGLGSSNEMCIDFLYYYPRYTTCATDDS